MNSKDLKNYLDKIYLKYKSKYSSRDPVWVLHEFQDAKDIEIIGLITSCYAYGQIDQINLFVKKFLNRIDYKVHEFTSNYSEHKDKKFLEGMVYRFNKEDDISLLIHNIKNVVTEYGSLQNLFLEKYDPSDKNILNSLTYFTKILNNNNSANRGYKYLLPSPLNNSTCKRLNLYLRWMIRKDDIDVGIWSDKADKSKLIMPVDTHIYRISRRLKLVKRKSCDMKFAKELTGRLKKFDNEDPVKYDFALCHIGIDKQKSED